MNAFLVDGSTIIRDRFKRMLAVMKQVQVIGEAGGIHEAMDGIRLQKPDVVLLDLPSSKGDGLEMLQCLKNVKPAPAVIIMTDDLHPLVHQKYLEAGADFLFDRSTEFEQVVPALIQLISRRVTTVGCPQVTP
jgi:two-component system response regulator DevR